MKLSATCVARVAGMALAIGGQCWANVTPPPELPTSFTWNGQTAPFWGYQYWSSTGTNEVERNFPRFLVTMTDEEVTKPSGAHQGFLGRYIRFSCENGYVDQLDKVFFFYVSGTGAGDYFQTPPEPPIETSGSPVRGIIDSPPRDYGATYTQDFRPTIDANGNWTVLIEGRLSPQPDRLVFSFNVWGNSMGMNTVQVTNWWFGENCIPAPATLCLVAAPLLAMRRRR